MRAWRIGPKRRGRQKQKQAHAKGPRDTSQPEDRHITPYKSPA